MQVHHSYSGAANFLGKDALTGGRKRGIIETTKKMLIFQGLSRLIQFRYEALCEVGKGGKQPLESQNGFLIAYFDPI